MVALSGFVLMLSFVAKESASARPVFPEERRLRLFHTHTGERIDIVYRRGDAYLDDALGRLDHFLRDHRTGQGLHYDPHLFDLLTDLTAAAGKPDAEIAVVCGYRSPWSNEFLRAHTAGVAKHSLHMQARAIDIRLPGVSTRDLRSAALSLHRGGVGYYPRSGFIHVDTGRVTQWCFGCSDGLAD
ncbi:MAG: twin-arginine translocation pathway signal protein [Acidobacteria bacterium]|nr:MAG: twin-arginine translocation pathway signal protein [Acidobacteriota bacterium]PYT84809.1 MAG: twin-arginine translocation pathway signal protein [Acidobacteriota bacterium]